MVSYRWVYTYAYEELRLQSLYSPVVSADTETAEGLSALQKSVLE
jgi:hypothetical protein